MISRGDISDLLGRVCAGAGRLGQRRCGGSLSGEVDRLHFPRTVR